MQLRIFAAAAAVAAITALPAAASPRSSKDDVAAVTAQNQRYQDAVLHSDAKTMDAILADDFVLYLSNGTEVDKAALLAEARNPDVHFDRNDCTNVRVRVWADTAVLSASLWEQGRQGAKTFDHRVDFADVYVRTPTGWRYVAGHAWPTPAAKPAAKPAT